MCSNIHPLIDLSSMYLLPYLQVQEKSLKRILWCSAERNKVCYFYSYQGPRSYSLLCCITLNSGVLESGFLSSWPLRSQWEPSEKPPKPEADLVSPLGSPRTLIYLVSLWGHLSQVTERRVYLSPLPVCELVVKIFPGHFIEPEKIKLDRIDFRGLSCQIRDWGAKNWNQEHRDLTFWTICQSLLFI